jgi:hypothetical protein
MTRTRQRYLFGFSGQPSSKRFFSWLYLALVEISSNPVHFLLDVPNFRTIFVIPFLRTGEALENTDAEAER